MKKRLLVIWLGFLLLISGAFLSAVLFSDTTARSQIKPIADLVFRNGKIITMDEDNPSASALAISDDKIVAVGSFHIPLQGWRKGAR